MKQFKLALLALAFVALTAGFSEAGTRVLVLSRMQWVKGATTDSTTVAIPFSAGVATLADTTAWLDLGAYNFAPSLNGSSTAAALVSFQLNAQQAASGDSIKVTFQIANDVNTYSTNFHAITAQTAVGNTGQLLTAIDSDDASFGRYVRAIVEHVDQSVSATRVVSLVPVLKIER